MGITQNTDVAKQILGTNYSKVYNDSLKKSFTPTESNIPKHTVTIEETT